LQINKDLGEFDLDGFRIVYIALMYRKWSAVRCHPPGGLEKGILEQGKLHCTQMGKQDRKMDKSLS